MRKPFLFLDFDGVLFDTLDEAYVVSSLAWDKKDATGALPLEGERYEFFKKYRYLCGPSGDFFWLFKCFYQGKNPQESLDFKRQESSEREEFCGAFYKVRQDLQRRQTKFWEGLNRPYQFLEALRSFLPRIRDWTYIVSTKDEETIQRLLELNNVRFFQNHILGKETFDRWKSKRKIMEMVLNIGSGEKAVFLDDGKEYLDEVRDWDQVQGYKAGWGYVDPAEPGLTQDQALEEILKWVGDPEGEPGFFGLEKNQWRILKDLKENHGIQGVKAEFEAEGSSFRDLVRLRRLTQSVGLPLHLKIGGVEAVRDIKDALELGVDGLIVPMVESPFGIEKFKEAFLSIYKNHRVHLSFNLETKTAVEQLPGILAKAQGLFHNVTIGRTDLSHSYFDKTITPDSEFIFKTIEDVTEKIISAGLTVTVGGSLSSRSLQEMETKFLYGRVIQRVETRKIIMDLNQALKSEKTLEKAIQFEESYILSKKEFQELFMENEVKRLTQLTRRV